MTVRLTSLTAAETPAAILLAADESVHVRAPMGELDALSAAGFREGPASIECFVRTPFSPHKLSRRHLNNRRALEAWRSLGLSLELAPLAEFGVDRVLETLYAPLFARMAYERGVTPHRIDQIEGMRALAEQASTLALVLRGREVVGAGLLRRGLPKDASYVVRGDAPSGDWEEGLVYALGAEIRACRRGFLIALADAVGARGASWLSLGRDVAWCELGYDAPWIAKLHLADAVVCRFDASRHAFSWSPMPGEALVFLEWDREARDVRPCNFGFPASRFEALVTALRKGTAGPS